MKKIAFAPETRNFIMTIIYIIFCIYSGYIVFTAEKISQKILFGILFLFILFFALYAEYLRHLYHEAIKTIAFDALPQKGLNQFDELLKKDLFKSYKSPKVIYDTLYKADMLDPDGLLKTLQENEKYFHQSIDNLLIWHYNQFYANFLLGNNRIAQDEYTKIIRMKDVKVKGQKLSPLYNWEFIDALYQFSRKDYKKSFNCFKKVNTQNMNNREKLHYYYHYWRLCRLIKNSEKSLYCKEQLLKIGGSSKIIEEVRSHENE